jgi:4-hydroxybenzoate polyprenyltransferase
MSPLSKNFGDIKAGNWVDIALPAPMRPYARLMRLDRPIGSWLLLIPCWWGVALASPGMPDLWLIYLFGIGAVVMRGAGCVINDIYDRDLDARVARTRTRPLASGEVKLWQAIIFLALLLGLGLLTLLQFNTFTIWAGVASLALVFTYPLMKRITWWPQLFLGFTFNWGALIGWSAVTATLGLPAFILYVAGIFWTLGYDTIYAHQDLRDDELIGVKSTARYFADRSPFWVALFYAVAVILLIVAGWSAHEGRGFYALTIFGVFYVGMQLSMWRMEDPANCLRRFKSNRDFGLIVLAGIIIGRFI